MQSRGAMAAGLAGLIVILAALVGSGIQPVAAQAGFTFYKLALQWPPTWCSAATCIQPYLREFTIHGLWPQLPPDTPVLPYAQNSTCTTVAPVQSRDIMQHLARGTRSSLWTFWPNLRDYNDPRANRGFWQYEWVSMGCALIGPISLTYISALAYDSIIHIDHCIQFLKELDLGPTTQLLTEWETYQTHLREYMVAIGMLPKFCAVWQVGSPCSLLRSVSAMEGTKTGQTNSLFASTVRTNFRVLAGAAMIISSSLSRRLVQRLRQTQVVTWSLIQSSPFLCS